MGPLRFILGIVRAAIRTLAGNGVVGDGACTSGRVVGIPDESGASDCFRKRSPVGA